jgi:hypothetical protein
MQASCEAVVAANDPTACADQVNVYQSEGRCIGQ